MRNTYPSTTIPIVRQLTVKIGNGQLTSAVYFPVNSDCSINTASPFEFTRASKAFGNGLSPPIEIGQAVLDCFSKRVRVVRIDISCSVTADFR